ncbi:Protein of unknown function [Gryllus bimaculatus]|nr:Protein of unknown function [Gryllus bimaculatus]
MELCGARRSGEQRRDDTVGLGVRHDSGRDVAGHGGTRCLGRREVFVSAPRRCDHVPVTRRNEMAISRDDFPLAEAAAEAAARLPDAAAAKGSAPPAVVAGAGEAPEAMARVVADSKGGQRRGLGRRKSLGEGGGEAGRRLRRCRGWEQERKHGRKRQQAASGRAGAPAGRKRLACRLACAAARPEGIADEEEEKEAKDSGERQGRQSRRRKRRGRWRTRRKGKYKTEEEENEENADGGDERKEEQDARGGEAAEEENEGERIEETAVKERKEEKRKKQEYDRRCRQRTEWGPFVPAYTLLIGSIFCDDPWRYRSADTLVQTSSGFAFLTAIMDIVLLFGLLVKEDKVLKYILCACMALYLVTIPLCVCNFFACAVTGYFDVPLWEIPRFGGCLLHLGLMYCLLSELRGDPLPPLSPPAAPAEGWLKNNLARTGPPAPTADDALLKVHVAHSDNANNNNSNSNAQPRGPAVFAPSSCTTAPAVLPAYAAAPAAGPPSSTDA